MCIYWGVQIKQTDLEKRVLSCARHLGSDPDGTDAQHRLATKYSLAIFTNHSDVLVMNNVEKLGVKFHRVLSRAALPVKPLGKTSQDFWTKGSSVIDSFTTSERLVAFADSYRVTGIFKCGDDLVSVFCATGLNMQFKLNITDGQLCGVPLFPALQRSKPKGASKR